MDFSGIRILVVGDVMLDLYLSGQVQRISPEAPVPVVTAEKRWSVLGGAGNVARNLSRLGVTAVLAGIVGTDSHGKMLEDELAAEGIGNALVHSSVRKTTIKTRILAQGQQLLRIDEEDCHSLDGQDFELLQKMLLTQLQACKAVIISDYKKGVLAECTDRGSLCRPIIAEAAKMGIPVLVDPKGGDWQRYAGAQCITPNVNEFNLACNTDNRAMTEDERSDLASDLRARYSIPRLLLTRGAKGMTLYGDGELPVHIQANAREVCDVSGAGDTVIAVLAACLAKGMGWKSSSTIANCAAGVVVGKLGTAPISLNELNQALMEEFDNPKILTLPSLLKKIAEWRHRNERIVFTNGCFDLLHPGHISLLEQCKGFGDRLVVGLNSDSSVRRLKGPSRPIQNEQSRAQLLTALQMVDAVIIFDEDTPLSLIESICPDTLVKGGDYTLETIVGADFVLQHGGEVHCARLVEGCSTTNLVKRLSGGV